MTAPRVAVVADPSNETVNQLLSVLLELGVETLAARDGAEALLLIRRDRPLLVLAEAGLGVVDGYALCSRLRREENTRRVPIVLLGSGDDREGRVAALKAGADDFILKPLDMEDVRLRLAALLRRSAGHTTGNGTRRTTDSAPRTSSPASVLELYPHLTALVGKVLEQAKSGQPLSLDGLREASKRLARTMGEPRDLLAVALGEREVMDLAAHHVNVAIFALALATGMGFSRDKLEGLAFLGLVHDLGMVMLPDSILYAPRTLTHAEFQLVTEHPRHTFEMLKACGREYEELAEAAYQEHEREKGQGYPRGLQGHQIHEFAKILGVADVYEACSHPRPYRKTFIPYDALQELIEMRGEHFHPRYIKALMNALTVYPLGSFVELNTGEVGRVVKTNHRNLMRPLVEILWNARGE
ncbi:MAG: HD domain-containing phosphohydrolase, partial [Acidobacteriota bacterium]